MSAGSFNASASRLAAAGRRFYKRGWALGTSGNFSVVISRRPLRLAITATSVAKGGLRAADILLCDERGRVVGRGNRKPSSEALIHVAIAQRRGARAILHTHSVWSTMISDVRAPEEGLTIQGYEMLKGLANVTSHEHREWIPILENDQDIPALARRVAHTLGRFPEAHAFLLRRHGLYTWGATVAEAERHVEILEFLIETVGRTGNSAIAMHTPGGSSWPL